MKITHVIAGTVLTVGGYYVGKLVGSVKTIKMVADIFEEEFPGIKKYVVKQAANKVVDGMFGSDQEEEEEESK